MNKVPAKYLGRVVSKANFRTNVYAPNGKKKVVESWDAFEIAMASGLWFATREDAASSIAEAEKPKRAKKKAKKEIKEDVRQDIKEDVKEVEPAKDLAFEVNSDDGFLPKESA